MSGETTYNDAIRYTVDNRAGRTGTAELKGDVRALERANKDAASSFGILGVAAAAGLAMGLHEAKKSLIDFNANVQNAKIGLSAMIHGNLGGTWEHATENANRLYTEFQKFSTETPVTTQEILNFGKAVAVMTFQAGGSIKDMTTITEKGVIAAKAFGYESAYTALEISEMLAGNVSVRMMFAKQMLGMAHVSLEEFRKMGAGERLKLVRTTLDSEAMKNAQREFSTSWTGVTTTLEDKLQIGLGAVGMPLFKAATAEIQRWNTWLAANEHKVANIAHSVGDGIAKGFGVMKDAIGFLIEHREALLTMGKIWLAVKVAGVLGGNATAGGTNLASRGSALMAWGRGARDSYDEHGNYVYQSAGAGRQGIGLKGAAANLGLLAQAAAVGYTVGTLLNDLTGLSRSIANLGLSQVDRKFEQVERASASLTEAMDKAADAFPKKTRAETNLIALAEQRKLMGNIAADAARAPMRKDREGNEFNSGAYYQKLEELEKMGVSAADINKAGGMKAFADQMNQSSIELFAKQEQLTASGRDAFEAGMTMMTDYQRATLDVNKASYEVMAYMNSHGMKFDAGDIVKIMRAATEDPEGKHKNISEKPHVNVHIARIEVQSDDPDRIAFGLIEQFRDAAKNPSSAFHSIREG
jgi:hypothetical protein